LDLGLKGKLALVTGAAKGIGKATAEQLAAERFKLCVIQTYPRELISKAQTA
jgi:3-oxoacyl-[acyl-carrier protein] reductase